MKELPQSAAQYLHVLIRFLSRHFLLACCFAYALPLAWYWLIGLDDGHVVWRSQVDWILTSYAANYFEHGLIRRGLIGSLLYHVRRETLEAVFIALNVAFIALCIVLVDRLTRPAAQWDKVDPWSLAVIRALFAMSPFTVMYFAHAFGMLELPNLMLLLACLAAVDRRRPSLAMVLSVIAILLHEAFILYGAPLIAALLVQGGRDAVDLNSGRGSALNARHRVGLLYAGIVTVTGFAVWWAGALDQATHIAFGSGQDAYSRGLFQPSLGMNARETAILLAITGGTYLWLYMVYSDNKRRPDLPFLATIVPVGLYALGIDYARWCAVIFIVVLTLVSLRVIKDGWRITQGRTTGFAALFLLPVGPVGIDYFLPVLKSVLRAVIGLMS